MIAELGHLALTLALAAALVQSVLPMVGAARGDAALMGSARATAILQAGLSGFAFAALVNAFAVSDFSVVNVYENSHTLKPMIFKIAAAWGSHEGSLLLWVLILALFGAGVAILGAGVPERLRARTLAVQAWIAVGFLTFLLLTSNPFDRLDPAPLEGTDLNPLLQHVGLALHPPLLYLGYVGLSIVFSFAVAALIEGRVDPAWARWVRPWTLAAWVFLTGGIALGSWWAYSELGWGGWWFWDPVENVSFMPWLAATALLHSAIVTEKRDAFKSWTILLAILAFSLSLFGTFIVRSGLLTSVHAFAVDPERGIYILGLLVVAIGGSLALFAVRAPAMEPGGLFRPISREGGLLMNNLVLGTMTGTVLFGTLYPLVLEGITGEQISVGAPYFDATFVPLMLVLAVFMGLGPLLPWKRADLAGALARLRVVAVLVLAVMAVVWWWRTDGPVLGLVAVGVATWLIGASLAEWAGRVKLFADPGAALRRARSLPRAAHGMMLAHVGVGVLILGATASTAWKEEALAFAAPGTSVEVAGYTVTMTDRVRVDGPNWIADRGVLSVSRGGEAIGDLTAERRFYPAANRWTTESGILRRGFSDLYVTVTEAVNEDAAGGARVLRAVYEPWVNLLWIGSAMLVVGGALSLSDRRLRVGAPRRAAPARGAMPAE
ncbi:cytochrome c-type biogenesis protein CcmF [Hasllibacter halocynthiae]|uniref:Cytochrome c-type biogenesis protein CcmF n=1 Tax=Hasllibacter halocynthiae TaxID=595589 RepID=A0A2T0X6P1_9RHOB|nr:heme lyase CcmF/NrfE family subunit [Hasllibacter halocynthiae]PRY94621.1 cytochrome c-type biogenesis protein CcmF [Hasllibacter halocynthiae]